MRKFVLIILILIFYSEKYLFASQTWVHVDNGNTISFDKIGGGLVENNSTLNLNYNNTNIFLRLGLGIQVSDSKLNISYKDNSIIDGLYYVGFKGKSSINLNGNRINKGIFTLGIYDGVNLTVNNNNSQGQSPY